MTTHHRIFTPMGRFVETVPWIDDDNGGLPDWFFEGNFVSLEVDEETNVVEFVPAVGPAPVWRSDIRRYPTNEELWSVFTKWFRENY